MTFRIANNTDIQKVANLHSLSWQTTYRGAFTDDFLDNHVHENRSFSFIYWHPLASTRQSQTRSSPTSNRLA